MSFKPEGDLHGLPVINRKGAAGGVRAVRVRVRRVVVWPFVLGALKEHYSEHHSVARWCPLRDIGFLAATLLFRSPAFC